MAQNRLDQSNLDAERVARLDLPGRFFSEESREITPGDYDRMRMDAVDMRIQEEDPEELNEVREQLNRDVRNASSEDDYEDESESEELLRRMPWLQYTAPEVLERASTRSSQYKGMFGAKRPARFSLDETNPYEGEAFREAVDDLREKITELKETAAGTAPKKKVRDKVYIPPMREKPKPVLPEDIEEEPEPAKAEGKPEPQKPESQKPESQKPEPFITSKSMAAAAGIAPEIREEVRQFKEQIIDLDDGLDAKEREEEKLERERFEAEEALAEDVIAEEGAEQAFDHEDTAAAFAPDEAEEEDAEDAPLSPMTAVERLKSLPDPEKLKRRKKTALDRLQTKAPLLQNPPPMPMQQTPQPAQMPQGQMQPAQMQQPQMPQGQMYAQPVQGVVMQPVQPVQGVVMQPVQPVMGQMGTQAFMQPVQGMVMQPVQPVMGQQMAQQVTQQLPPVVMQPVLPQSKQAAPSPKQGPAKSGFDFTVDGNAGFDF